MCGITGILRFKGPPLNKETLPYLRGMGRRLRNRGPDDEQIFVDGDKVAFLFRRLSIIDLEGGRQPMTDRSDNVVVMVNGEIYNYQQIRQKHPYPYKSHCDCEVILPLYLEKGERLVEDLIGMFAIALWDKREDKLFLIRDHLGIKPLFYTITPRGHLLFASEIKALLAHPDCPRELDWDKNLTRREYSHFLLDQPLTSGFKDIVYLPAGSMLIIDQKAKTLKTSKWWSLQFKEEKDDRTENEVIEGYRDLLQESVHMQLMSDVEVGIAFSGGIDSVAIAAFAAQKMPIKTFTVLNLSTWQHGDSEAAVRAAKYLGMPNYQLYFPWQNTSFDPALCREAIYACEMFFDMEHLFKYILYAQIKKSFPHIKTLLLGQGSDEFNGGYCHIWIKEYFPHIPEEQHDWELFWKALKRQKKMGQIYRSSLYLTDYANFLDDNYFDHFKDIDPWEYYQSFHTKSIEDYNLWHEDRNTAANQLENRVPFLDHRLVEFTARVPKKLRPKLFWEKRILREALKPFLPRDLLERPKVPFYKGAAERYTFRTLYDMMRANNNEFMNEALFENPHVKGILDIPYLKNYFDTIPECPTYIGLERLAMVASFGLWAKWAKENIEVVKDAPIDLSWIDVDQYGMDALSIKLSGKDIITEDTILAFVPEVLLVSDKNKTHFYLTKNEDVIFVLEKPAMIQFFQHIDGEQTVKAILSKIPYKLGDLLADLEEGLEYGVLEIKKS